MMTSSWANTRRPGGAWAAYEASYCCLSCMGRSMYIFVTWRTMSHMCTGPRPRDERGESIDAERGDALPGERSGSLRG